MKPYPSLFSPLKVSGVTIKNRICLAPMSFLKLGHDKGYTKDTIAFYERVAKGGAGLVTLGEAIVSTKTGSSGPHMLRITDPSVFYSLCDVAEAVHRHNALISIEISHAGGRCIAENNGGRNPMSASSYVKPSGVLVSEMTLEQMTEVANEFGDAALTLKRAGFDMVMFHAGHGWLIHQFLSPMFNHREDEFGGSVENCVRFPIMCLENIREKCGRAFPIDMRITGDEIVEGGYGIDYCVELCRLLQNHVDMISVSAGGIYDDAATRRMSMGIFLPRGYNVPLAEAVKKAVRVPVTCVGGLAEPQMMEGIIAGGKADMVTLGRALICDSELPRKAMRGQTDDIYKCMRCFECHGRLYTKGSMKCSINPTVGMDFERQFSVKAAVLKKVLIVGGGPAGMQAAVTAAERGHEVTLYEKSGELGGKLKFADFVDFKKDLAYFRHQLAARVEKAGVKIVLGKELTPNMAEKFNPDVLIVALGAQPIVPPIPGIDGGNVILGTDVYTSNKELGQRVVVIGGGLVGCEIAADLAGRGKDVTIIEMLPVVAGDTNFSHKNALSHALATVKIYTNTRCKAIDKGGVTVETPDGEAYFKADTAIVSVGMRPLSGWEFCSASIPEVHVIGDCSGPKKVGDAISAGYNTALEV